MKDQVMAIFNAIRGEEDNLVTATITRTLAEEKERLLAEGELRGELRGKAEGLLEGRTEKCQWL